MGGRDRLGNAKEQDGARCHAARVQPEMISKRSIRESFERFRRTSLKREENVCSYESRLHFRHLVAFGILPPMCHIGCRNVKMLEKFLPPPPCSFLSPRVKGDIFQ